MASTKQINPNGLAIVETLLAHKGEVRAFAEIADEAHIEPKTGFLTSAKKIALEKGFRIEKVEGGVKAIAKTLTEYPNGLKVETSKEVVLDGYRLVDKE